MDDEFDDDNLDEEEQAELEAKQAEQEAQEEAEAEEEEEEAQRTYEEELRQQLLEKQFKQVETKVQQKKIFLKKDQKQTLKDAEKNKKLKARAIKTKYQHKANVGRFILNNLYPIGIALLIIMAVFILLAGIFAIAVFIDSLFGSSGGDGGMNSQLGASGQNFHAVRLIYRDDELAGKQTLNEYADLIYGALDSIESTETCTISVNITKPEGDDFDETKANADLVALMKTAAKQIYVADNPDYASQGTDIEALTLTELAAGVKYFGFSAANLEMFKTEILSDNFIFKNFNQADGIISYQPIGEATITDDEVKQIVSAALERYFESLTPAQSEKLFVRDCVLTGDGKLTNVEKKNYVALMYLPKEQVNFNTLQFYVNGVDTNNFSIEYNGTKHTSYTEWPVDDDRMLYLYSLGSGISAPAVDNFDKESAVTTPKSLAQIASNPNADSYLQADAETGIFTYKEQGVTIKFNSTLPFMFADEVALK